MTKTTKEESTKFVSTKLIEEPNFIELVSREL
jgi:hypothetical protein